MIDSMFVANAMVFMDMNRQQMNFHHQYRPMQKFPPTYTPSSSSMISHPMQEHSYNYEGNDYGAIPQELDYDSIEVFNPLSEEIYCYVKFEVEEEEITLRCEITDKTYLPQASELIISQLLRMLKSGKTNIHAVLGKSDIYGYELLINTGFMDINEKIGEEL